MIPAQRLAIAAGVVMLIAAAALAIVSSRDSSPAPGARSPPQRPRLLLLSSLPLMFSEDFSLKGAGSPVLSRLQSRYRVIPISVTSERELAKAPLLLMAQPQAQTPQNLVALDAWVRRGGRVLLFADPLLEWPSKRPLGDILRPPPVFADTGLLEHWGFRLDAPTERGPKMRRLGGKAVLTVSPGAFSGNCAVSPDRFTAKCRIGQGRVTVVADADLLNAPGLGSSAQENIDAVVEELASLEH